MNTLHIIHLWDIVKVVLKENLWINLEYVLGIKKKMKKLI